MNGPLRVTRLTAQVSVGMVDDRNGRAGWDSCSDLLGAADDALAEKVRGCRWERRRGENEMRDVCVCVCWVGGGGDVRRVKGAAVRARWGGCLRCGENWRRGFRAASH
mmetsp:Transcript_3537/g.9760  ORF Transcript_3537/g.9760 Transcript_3537/m.9760 type:complete len:108 (-) Transcript_3537:1569-1892(-)